MNTIFCAHFFSCGDVDCSRYLGVLRRRDTKTLTHFMSTHKHIHTQNADHNSAKSVEFQMHLNIWLVFLRFRRGAVRFKAFPIIN